MKRFILLFMIIIFVGFVAGVCEEGQIDINSASLSELDELYGVGPVKAQAIIDTRPYESVDDLINVYGIGGITLNNIKSQGLACVDSKGTIQTNIEEVEENYDGEVQTTIGDNSPKVLETIKLDSPKETKDIKSEGEENKLGAGDYAFYGLVAFCVLLGILFLIKFKKKHVSEFE